MGPIDVLFKFRVRGPKDPGELKKILLSTDSNQLFFRTDYTYIVYSSQKMRQRCFLPEMGLARASGQIVVTSGLYKKMAMHWSKRTYLVLWSYIAISYKIFLNLEHKGYEIS